MSRWPLIMLAVLLIPFASPADDIDSEMVNVQRAANFFSDYVDYFNVPPNYVVYNHSAYDLSTAYQIFIKYVSGLDLHDIEPIAAAGSNFLTNKECYVTKEDAVIASTRLNSYIQKKKNLPMAIKIGDCLISNSDFLYLLSKMIRSEFEDGSFPKGDTAKMKYFSRIIKWNAYIGKKRFIEFTMDYESDRPVFSDKYTKENAAVISGVSSIGINPGTFQGVCNSGFCTLPNDYAKRNYSSYEIAWYTGIKKEGKIFFPECYPFCGVINGTPLLLDKFAFRYGFPVTWHMTGDSIVVISSIPKLRSKVLKARDMGLLSFGLHTMYHTHCGKVSSEFLNNSLKENYLAYQKLLANDSIQFRAPYLILPTTFSYQELLGSNGINKDNEDFSDLSFCDRPDKCNYGFDPEKKMYNLKLDWKVDANDELINYYLSHPWEVIFEAEGNPIYLKESRNAAKELFKKWILPVGKDGLIPILPNNYIGMMQR